MTRIVTGLFQKRRDLDLVVEHLVQEFNVPRERIQIHAFDATGEEARSPQDDDLEVSLAELGLPGEAVRHHAERMRGGGILLAAWVEEDHLQQILDACREYGAAEPQAHDPEQRIRERAYQLWEQEGRPEGRDVEFWHRARQALAGDEGAPASRAPRQFGGETGAPPLPERDPSPGR
jgi:hypothetical protein